jgi:uncharacterized protein (DUF1015 family)
MATIKPFRALRPLPEHAKDVSCVPYDVVTTKEARQLASGNPLSFLHVTRADIDMPDGRDAVTANPAAFPAGGAGIEGAPAPEEPVHQRALRNFEAMKSAGLLVQEDRPCVYVYRLAEGDRAQTGLACCCAVGEYDRNVIKKHERTKKDKEDDRLAHMLAIDAHTEPVLIAFKGNRRIKARLDRAGRGSPLFDFVSEDGVRNTLWRVEDPKPFVELLERIPALYIADGHHRAAAASRLLRHMEGVHGAVKEGAEVTCFPAVLFPSDELRILPYNRYVRDLNGMGAREFLEAVKRRFSVEADDAPDPDRKGVFGMYLQEKWYRLVPREPPPRKADPVAALDHTTLHERILRPLLGVLDQARDGRIDFAGGKGSIEKLRSRVDAEGGVAFTTFPVSLEELFRVADGGMIMPPKSTWFWPKLRSGLFIHTF